MYKYKLSNLHKRKKKDVKRKNEQSLRNPWCNTKTLSIYAIRALKMKKDSELKKYFQKKKLTEDSHNCQKSQTETSLNLHKEEF